MSEFKLERFKYNWTGPWLPGTTYNRDDVVNVNSKSYVCIKQHVSNADFNIDLKATVPLSSPPVPDPYWILMTGGQSFVGRWTNNQQYEEGDIVLFDGSLWLAISGHYSTTFVNDNDNWQLFVNGQEYVKNWIPNKEYGAGAIVKYNGLNYKCVISHTSSNFLENNINDWTLFTDSNMFVGDFDASTFYKKNDYVNFGGSIYVVLESHISGNEIDRHKFELVVPGYVFADVWDETVYYGVGDIVNFGGTLYICLVENYAVSPASNDDSISYWEILLASVAFTGEFSVEQAYKPGDLAKAGGQIYRAVQVTGADPSYDDLEDINFWKLFIPGQKWTNFWKNQTRYVINDLVYFLGETWRCNTTHISAIVNIPGDNGKGFFYWDLVVQSGSEAGMNNPGDLLTYDFQREFVGDTSTIGPTAVNIGDYDQLLSINQESSVFWRTIHQTETTVVYVTPTGVDSSDRGLDPYHPFRTINYACRFVETRNIMPCKISVSTGRYEEILPIVVPKMTVVMGDELRATNIVAKGAGENNSTVIYNSLAFGRSLFTTLISGDLPDVHNENPFTPVPLSDVIDNPQPLVDYYANLTDEITDAIELLLQGENTNITITGSNNLSAAEFIIAANLIKNNANFLATECMIYSKSISLTVINEDKLVNDMLLFLEGYEYDFRYEGNYKTQRYSKLYVNGIIGSEKENMFLVRDITGVRNCTTEGLTGTITGERSQIQTTRVSGGAFVSLDPGWGPDDQSVWIQNRSPYIQGVTTIGVGCIGAHIDGDLHNGGNRSLVANDFTQVISDGIGAYILNRGRVELVSVFTYYCFTGYLAENGGTIRATNGNNSYGEYGSVAIGIDDAEIPQTATVNNRTTQASVYSAFAGEISDDTGELDRLLIFEYSHCGENYLNATATVVGAGNFVNTKYDNFRQGGIKQIRLLEPQDSTRIGGLGYTNVKNNAQEGTDSTILLSATDLRTAEDYVGQRLVITSGPGTGQYGYIQAYDDDENSNDYRTATIYKESDDTAGFDHIVPGTVIEPLLTASTTYSIEPRVTIPHPGYDTTLSSIGQSKLWTDITWGITTEQFLISLDFGEGETDGVVAARAALTITKTGSVYSVAIDDPGAGYAVGETYTIVGSSIGGNDEENDLNIKITEVTDDSTASVVAFDFDGLGLPGKFVVISDGNFVSVSVDGVNWEEYTLPTIQTWNKVINGDGIFIAIPTGLSSIIARSTTATAWSSVVLPSSLDIKDIAYGDGVFVILTNSNTSYYSTNGTTWSTSLLTNAITTDWTVITYGYDKFIALSDAEAIATGVYENGVLTWTVTGNIIPVNPNTSNPCEFRNMIYLAGRILALTIDNLIVSCITETLEVWTVYDNLPLGNWTKISQGNGLYFLTTTYEGNLIGISEDGVNWRTEELPLGTNRWNAISFGYTGNTSYTYCCISYNDSDLVLIDTGKQALARTKISSNTIEEVVIWDPGSGYKDNVNYSTEIFYDNQWVSQAFVTLRFGLNVLSQPSFINRGIGYRSSTTRVTIDGDGFADIIPSNAVDLVVDGLVRYPGPGAQLRIAGILDEDEDPEDEILRILTLVTITPLGSDGTLAGTFRAQIRVSPKIQNKDFLTHGRSVEIRERYSQCRVTGHDFLDIGTGNFEQTNYPELYAGGAFFIAKPEQEVIELSGGRVFYVSTDQDGNFRTGELFAVEQATGIVTISADFFSLDGLSELALGGVRLGGSGTVIREFSTDPVFFADSDNVVPTQRAIIQFIQERISAGGGEVLTNELIAGQVRVGTTENIISTTTGFKVNFDKRMDFYGVSNKGVKGTPLALSYYLRNFDT